MLINIPYLHDTLSYEETKRVATQGVADALRNQVYRTLEAVVTQTGLLHGELCTRHYDDDRRPEYVRAAADSITQLIDTLYTHRNRLRDLAAAQESVAKSEPAAPAPAAADAAAPTEEVVAA